MSRYTAQGHQRESRRLLCDPLYQAAQYEAPQYAYGLQPFIPLPSTTGISFEHGTSPFLTSQSHLHSHTSIISVDHMQFPTNSYVNHSSDNQQPNYHTYFNLVTAETGLPPGPAPQLLTYNTSGSSHGFHFLENGSTMNRVEECGMSIYWCSSDTYY